MIFCEPNDFLPQEPAPAEPLPKPHLRDELPDPPLPAGERIMLSVPRNKRPAYTIYVSDGYGWQEEERDAP